VTLGVAAMPRRCNDCKYTIDTHADRCPRCGGYMAIVCRTGGNARPEDDPRHPMATDQKSGRRTWMISAIVALVALAGVLAYFNWRGGRAGRDGRPNPTADKAVARISLGMPIRDAVLALEPEPDPSRRVSLHDLLGPNAPTSGSFTYSDGRRMTSVRFRDGKVTSVNETVINLPPGMIGQLGETTHVTITAGDEEVPRAKDEAPRP
jgi:hypothetical protein